MKAPRSLTDVSGVSEKPHVVGRDGPRFESPPQVYWLCDPATVT